MAYRAGRSSTLARLGPRYRTGLTHDVPDLHSGDQIGYDPDMIRSIERSIVASILLVAPVTLPAQTAADSGVFIVRHATDTVATEHFVRTPTHLDGTLAIHNAKRSSQRYSAVIAPDATLPLIEVTVREGLDTSSVKARVVQRARVIFKEDSVAVDEVGGAGLMTRVFGTERGALPYLNLSFALLEQAVRQSHAHPHGDRVVFFNLGGGQTRNAKLSPLGRDSLSIHIGEVEFLLRVDPSGRVLGGRIPKQDVVVDRL